jgi:hypothetical protein
LAIVNAERLAGTTISAALDPSLAPEKRARLALEIIEAADPKVSTVATLTGELDPSSASLSDLLRYAEAQGISLERPAGGPELEPGPTTLEQGA